MLLQTETYDSLNDLVTDKSVKEKLERVIKEYTRREELQKYGLQTAVSCYSMVCLVQVRL